jgi:signal transduction histidine kinase/ActR/RegA family two-component response regulator
MKTIRILAAWLSILLGLLVLTGWVFQIQIFIQLHPHLVPMQFNTALGFLLGGAALIALRYQKNEFAQGLGTVVFLVGGLTLFQYATGLDLYIDQLFMEHNITTKSAFPGRMAPATASAYLLCGIALVLVSTRPERHLLITGMLASFVFALGLGNGFGYTLGTDTPFGATAPTYMAVHTSIGFMLLGTALFTHVLTIAHATNKNTPSWIPWPVGVCLATLSIALWQVLQTNETFQIERNIQTQASGLANQIHQSMSLRIKALDRIGRRWEADGGTPRAKWDADVIQYLSDDPGYQAIEWVDKTFHVRWILPLEGNERAQDLNLAAEERRRLALIRAQKAGYPVLSSPVNLVQGGKGILLCVPLNLEGAFDGFILGVFRTQKLLSPIIDSQSRVNFSISIFIEDEKVFDSTPGNGEPESSWTQTARFQILGTDWYVSLRPSTDYLSQVESNISTITLAVSLLFTVLIMLLVNRSQIAKRRELEIAETNRNLEKLVQRRTFDLAESNTLLIAEIDERKRLQERLVQTEKLEAIGHLTGGIAHDFNNLLAVIQGNAEIIGDQVPDTLNEETRSIMEASARGAELTQRLLAFGRKQPLRAENLDMAALLEGLSRLLNRTLGETIEIDVRTADDLWPAMADLHQVENAILNLALNARDAMPGGGRLTIECANIRLDKIFIAENPEVVIGDYVSVSVTDTGIGMSPEVLQHAFDPFFTTKDVGEGSGLGLSMVYGFAKQSKGHVTIKSKENSGTTVTLYLPHAAGARNSDDVNTLDGEKLLGHGEHLLVIEDDENVRLMVTKAIDALGYRVTSVATASDADDILGKEEDVELIITDIVLPGGVSGPEFAQATRKNYPGIKIIFMSGYPAVTAGHHEFPIADEILLDKPFTREKLAQAICTAFDTADPESQEENS